MTISQRHRSLVALILFTALILSGCIYRPYFKPPGKSIASCEGRIKLSYGDRTKFRVDVFSQDDGDITLWFSLPRRGISYRKIDEISLEDGMLKIETISPSREYRGTVSTNRLKFKGDFYGFAGAFMLNFDK